jgi:hypothetical protein
MRIGIDARLLSDSVPQTLKQNHGNTVELCGMFADKSLNAPVIIYKTVGNIEQLIELGKHVNRLDTAPHCGAGRDGIHKVS